MNIDKLKRLQAQVRIGGKGTPRRKKKVIHQTAAADDKKLQSSLKKLSVSTIPGIEEVNIIKDDLTVIHFNNPKAQASLSANTFAVTGHGETKKIVEMLPEILPQLGQETVVQLRMFANSMTNNQKPVGEAEVEANLLANIDDDDVPLLVSDFDEIAKKEDTSSNKLRSKVEESSSSLNAEKLKDNATPQNNINKDSIQKSLNSNDKNIDEHISSKANIEVPQNKDKQKSTIICEQDIDITKKDEAIDICKVDTLLEENNRCIDNNSKLIANEKADPKEVSVPEKNKKPATKDNKSTAKSDKNNTKKEKNYKKDEMSKNKEGKNEILQDDESVVEANSSLQQSLLPGLKETTVEVPISIDTTPANTLPIQDKTENATILQPTILANKTVDENMTQNVVEQELQSKKIQVVTTVVQDQQTSAIVLSLNNETCMDKLQNESTALESKHKEISKNDNAKSDAAILPEKNALIIEVPAESAAISEPLAQNIENKETKSIIDVNNLKLDDFKLLRGLDIVTGEQPVATTKVAPVVEKEEKKETIISKLLEGTVATKEEPIVSPSLLQEQKQSNEETVATKEEPIVSSSPLQEQTKSNDENKQSANIAAKPLKNNNVNANTKATAQKSQQKQSVAKKDTGNQPKQSKPTSPAATPIKSSPIDSKKFDATVKPKQIAPSKPSLQSEPQQHTQASASVSPKIQPNTKPLVTTSTKVEKPKNVQASAKQPVSASPKPQTSAPLPKSATAAVPKKTAVSPPILCRPAPDPVAKINEKTTKTESSTAPPPAAKPRSDNDKKSKPRTGKTEPAVSKSANQPKLAQPKATEVTVTKPN